MFIVFVNFIWIILNNKNRNADNTKFLENDFFVHTKTFI